MSVFSQSYVQREFIFGQVPVATTAVKTYTLKNRYNIVNTYYVTRNVNTNPFYYVFDVNKYEAKVEPGGEFVLRISYSPNVPGSKDFDTFTIADIRENTYELTFRGECVGPAIGCSVRNITFVQTPKRSIRKRIFLLSNNSKIQTVYQFDCSNDQGVFQVEPKKGTLGPQEHEYITVRFFPQTPTFYSRQLCCLILNHETIIVNLFGIFSESTDYNPNDIILRYYPSPHEERVGFRAYFSDSVNIKRIPPPLSLSVNNLDFGRMLSKNTCHTLTTSVTNHMEQPVKIEWEKVESFQIYPKKLEIPPKKSALYECRFQPEESCILSLSIIHGHIFWSIPDDAQNVEYDVNVPIPINLRCIGHTFPKEQVWISSITVTPTTIVLPLSLPTFPTWTTFMIEAYGPFPILYKLLPPTRTNFIMKPMMGLIRDYQIVAVQLESSAFEPKSYIEKWNIEVNGQPQGLTQIYVKAQTDIPRVRVGDNNCIQFEPVHPGSQVYFYLPVKNVSFCQLQYEFLLNNKIGVDQAKGFLSPNEETHVTCWYNSDTDEDGSIEMEMICRVQCIYNEDAIVGEPVDISVTVKTEAVYSELCALPPYHDCKDVEYGTVVETSFYLFNFGDSHICFKLTHDHDLNNVDLNPQFGKLGPREKIKVTAEFRIINPGKHTLFISYNNRLSSCNSEIVHDDVTKNIFRIEYKCGFPVLQIMDILEHNFGDYICNKDLWHLFKIDEINVALAEANVGEIRTVDLCVPDAEVSDKVLYLVFALKNTSSFYTRILLKRRQICDCKRKESLISITFRVKVFDCAHKDMFSMEIVNPNIPPDFTAPLTVKIKYLLPGRNKLSYVMELSSHRTIILNIFIECIPHNTSVLSVVEQNYTLDMGHVYIGLREPPIFAFWLYNNTPNVGFYKLDDLEITKLCNADGFPVLKCLKCEGCLAAYSSEPVLFKFWPIEVKSYKVSVPLLLGEKQATLTIIGYGTLETNKFRFADLLSEVSHPTKNGVVNLSVDHLVIEPILVANTTQHMFFIKNKNTTNRVQYTWKPCFIDGLVKIEPMIVSEILKPKESHPVILKITSLNEPCSIRILLSLEFVDYEELNEKIETVRRQRSSIKEFTITDKQEKRANAKEENVHQEEVQEPKYFNISLPINVNIVGFTDRDNCIPVENQMNLKPYDQVKFDVDKFVNKYFERIKVKESPIHPEIQKPTFDEKKPVGESLIKKEIIQNALEHVVGDAIFSDYFLEVTKNLKTEPSPFYSQFQRDVCKKEEQLKEETKAFFACPQPSEVNYICKEIVADSLQMAFHLGPVMKKHPDQDKGFQE